MKEKIILFENNVQFIVYKGETLYSLEGILKYFSIEYKHIDPLILEFEKHYSSLNIIKKSFSSSQKYFVDTVNALRIVMCLSGENADIYKNWFLKCVIDRINEIIDPNLGYDRIKTILYKKGITSKYSFIYSDLNTLSNKKGPIKLDRQILYDDIYDKPSFNLKLINEKYSAIVVKTSRNKTTNFL